MSILVTAGCQELSRERLRVPLLWSTCSSSETALVKGFCFNRCFPTSNKTETDKSFRCPLSESFAVRPAASVTVTDSVTRPPMHTAPSGGGVA